MDQPSSFFVLSELDVLSFWDQAQIFQQSLDQVAPQGDYRFYDGPPFATGTPHYGHIVASVIKDVVPRFWTMKGYRVNRRWGWDCHGLPIENIVEKELNYQSKKDIEKLGIAQFNELCRSKVLSYVDDWEKIIHRLGRFVDMKQAYRTMDLPFMESVWWVFKQLWDKGLIYQGYRSMHICPRCQTTLSQSEVADGYKEIKDLSAVAKLLISSSVINGFSLDLPTYLLVWTTTPWTLLGNVAVAVGTDINYSLVQFDQAYYLVAEDRVADVFSGQEIVVVKRFSGQQLVGLAYQPPFTSYYQQDDLENKVNGWQVYGADFVNTEDGTGLVHIAPSFGEDDLQLGQQYNLPFIQHITMDGTIKEEAGDLRGLNVKPKNDHSATDIEVIKYLAKHELLFSKEKYEHSYPHCWRCDTPLINYATSSWFVNITKIKPQLLAEAEKINWSPNYIKDGRFGNWLAGARDWSISRQRYWASVMPVWQCDCGHYQVFGSAKELEQASGQEIKDLHKDVVDLIKVSCPQCGQLAQRIPDVLDTWFDSGSMPYAQDHYPFSSANDFLNSFPAQFIAEGVDQTRCWFYYLHVIGTGLGLGAAFQNVIVNGIVLAEDGKKMSKRLENYPDPQGLLDKYGADALRYYLLTSPVVQAENLNFSDQGVAEVVKKLILPVWNVYKFYDLYEDNNRQVLTVDDWTSDNLLDRWIVARLHQLINEVNQQMEAYNLAKASRPIIEFIDDLSTWYLRRSRDRFKRDDLTDKSSALLTTSYVLQQLSVVMAPFVPFLAEALWQKTTGYNYQQANRSVHLLTWPEDLLVDQLVVEEMSVVRQLAELALAQRDLAGLKVRQALTSLTVEASADRLGLVSSTGWSILTDELNVKKIIQQASPTTDWRVSLDAKLTPELIREGLARELVRRLNLLRKQSGLTLIDQTIVYWRGSSQLVQDTITEWADLLKQETLSIEISNDWPESMLVSQDLKVDDGLITIAINKF